MNLGMFVISQLEKNAKFPYALSVLFCINQRKKPSKVKKSGLRSLEPYNIQMPKTNRNAMMIFLCLEAHSIAHGNTKKYNIGTKKSLSIDKTVVAHIIIKIK